MMRASNSLLLIATLILCASSKSPFSFHIVTLEISSPPAPITLLDSQGQPVNGISLTRYCAPEEYTLSTETESGDWSFDPELPEEIYFSSVTRTLQGAMQRLFERKEYTVTLRNSEGETSLTFYIESTECKEEFLLVRSIADAGEGNSTVTWNGKVLESIHFKYGADSRYFCVPRGELTWSYNCTASPSKCFGVIRSTQNTTFLSMHVDVGTTKTETTSMVAKEPPTLSADKTELMLMKQERFQVQMTVPGIHNNVEFSPALPSAVGFDQKRLILSGYFENDGFYAFTVTVSNAAGSSSVQLHFRANVCESGYDVRFYREFGMLPSLQILSGDSVVVDYKGNDENVLFCLEAGEYYLAMRNDSSSAVWSFPVYRVDSKDRVMEIFKKVTTEEVQKERFVVGDAVARGSPFKETVAAELEASWMTEKYKDKDWKESVAGQWGRFNDDSKKAYFRRQFSVSDPLRYSLFAMEVELEDSAIVYLNGAQLRRFDESSLRGVSSLMAPATLLKKKNQLAVVVIPQSAAPHDIVFDARLFLITTQCLTSAAEGDASDDQEQPDPSHPASLAFADSNDYWLSSKLPVNLSYRLREDAYLMPTVMTMKETETGILPTEFSVFGQVVEGKKTVVEEEIGNVKSATFLAKTSRDELRLAPKRPYNAFRIQFLDSSNHTAVAASGITFKMCQDAMCKRAIGRKATVVGGRVSKRCPFGSYGEKYLVCGRDDVKPAWIKDESMCLKKHSPKGIAFIDTGFHFDGLRAEKIDVVERVSQMEIPEHLTVWNDQISIPYAVEKEGDTVSVDSIVRFTVEEEIGRYVTKKMTSYADVYASYLRQRLGESIGVDNATVSSLPRLYLPIAWSSIVMSIVVFLVVILAFLCGLYCMYYHFRPKSHSGVKRLTRTKDSEGLLANSA